MNTDRNEDVRPATGDTVQINTQNKPKTGKIGRFNISCRNDLALKSPKQEMNIIFSSPVVNRLKLRSALSEDKSALLQKGRFTFRYEEKKPQSSEDQGTRQLPNKD